MVTATYIPERGDLVWINFDPQAGRRPAVVLSPKTYNGKVGLLVACPVTSRVKGYPFEVTIPDGLNIEGVILSDQLKSLDWRNRNAQFIDRLPESTTTQVLRKIEVLIGLRS
jgi:mRNA interferase MazF